MSDSTKYDNDVITVSLRTRIWGGWGPHEYTAMTVKEVRELRRQLAGRTYENTKRGDKVFISASGTLNQIVASGGNI